MSFEGEFSSSNSLCPVISNSLLDGTDFYDFVDNGSDFVMTMKEEQNNIADIYPYMV